MVIIFWRGWGILVAIAGMLGYAAVMLVIKACAADSRFFDTHVWAKLLAVAAGTLAAYGAVKYLEHSDQPRVVIDKHTGKEIELRRRDALFGVPVRYWPYLILGGGTLVAIFG
jgi:hypothetical protein